MNKTSTKISQTETATKSRPGQVATSQTSTKDTGRVHIGGGMMRFRSTKDAGRVHVGGGMMRF